MDIKTVCFLLVEDNDDLAEMITAGLLAESGVVKTVERVHNGAEAIGYLLAKGTYKDRLRPHVVLLDLKLDRGEGIALQEVLGAIKTHAELCTIPLIVLMDAETPVQKLEAFLYKANSCLIKPMDPGEFHEMMKALANYWGTWNE